MDGSLPPLKQAASMWLLGSASTCSYIHQNYSVFEMTAKLGRMIQNTFFCQSGNAMVPTALKSTACY